MRGNTTATTANIIVYSITHNAGAIAGTDICPGGTVNITNSSAATTGTPASTGPTYSWDRAPSPFTVWTALAGSAATFSEVMAVSGIYRYRRTATFGCGTAVSTTVDVDVFSTTHNAGAIAITNICAGSIVNVTSSTAATTGAPASTGPTYSWERSPTLFSQSGQLWSVRLRPTPKLWLHPVHTGTGEQLRSVAVHLY